ncbi:hypothetical protein V6N13_040342 [Hibiscus sabdariffa]
MALGPPDFQGPPGAHRTPRDVRCSSGRWTLPPAELFPGWAVPFTWNLSLLQHSKFSFEYLLLPPRSAPTGTPPGLTPQVLRRTPRPPTHRGLALTPTAGYRSRAEVPSIFGAS